MALVSAEMSRAKLVALTVGPVRNLLVAGGGDLVHLVALDGEGRPLSQAQLRLPEVAELIRALQEMREVVRE